MFSLVEQLLQSAAETLEALMAATIRPKLHQPGSLSLDSLGSVCADMAAPCRLLVEQLLQSSAETLEALMGATIRPSYTSQAV